MGRAAHIQQFPAAAPVPSPDSTPNSTAVPFSPAEGVSITRLGPINNDIGISTPSGPVSGCGGWLQT